LPTSATYIITSIMAAPALIQLGVPKLVAHMFVFYFGILADLTPPTAISTYATSSIAGADVWKTQWTAMTLALSGFIIPFSFAYDPALMMLGASPTHVALRTAAAALGIVMLGAGLIGYLRGPTRRWERALLLGGALHEAFHGRARQPRSARAGSRLPAGHVERGARRARDDEEPRDDPAAARGDRPRQGGGRPRPGRRPDGVPRPEVALPRGRPVHPHLLRDRHARSRHARHERRDLSRHDRHEEHDAVPPGQGRPALGPALPEVHGPRRADGGRVRDRLGPDHALPRGLADPGGCLGVGRDGRLSRGAGGAGPLRDRRPGGSRERRDRDRRSHHGRSGDVRDRGALRRVHRVRLRR